MNLFAIGDIHGCLSQLTTLHKKILTHDKFDVKNDLLIYLGDYIDRGNNTKEVINQILKLKNNKIKTINLMGNHDEFMIDFLFNKKNDIKNWLNFGVDETFRSYNIEIVEFIKDGFEDDVIDKLRNELLEKMNATHINFFKNLEVTHSTEKYLFVHAGIDPQKKLSEQTKKDYLWSRSSDFFHKDFKAEKKIIHGHTPEKDVINHPYRINIDTGCYFSGKLTCVCLNEQNDDRFFISNL
jgi:serine/threonine protein phosphatase 1